MQKLGITLAAAVLLSVSCVAQTPIAASNQTTQLVAFLLPPPPIAVYSGLPGKHGVMATVCDARTTVVAFSVQVAAMRDDGTSYIASAVLTGPKNQLGCLTGWFDNTGKLKTLTVSATALQARSEDSVVAQM